jgi:hypothetical protein
MHKNRTTHRKTPLRWNGTGPRLWNQGKNDSRKGGVTV